MREGKRGVKEWRERGVVKKKGRRGAGRRLFFLHQKAVGGAAGAGAMSSRKEGPGGSRGRSTAAACEAWKTRMVALLWAKSSDARKPIKHRGCRGCSRVRGGRQVQQRRGGRTDGELVTVGVGVEQ